MPSHALNERSELVESLHRAGPDAPTVIPDWTTSQLAAHLYLRERSVLDLAGRVPVRRMQDYAQHHLDSFVAAHPYEQVVAKFAAGPPRWSPLAIPSVFDAINTLEYVVHHEDVRRAAQNWQPRELPNDRVAAIWARLRVGAKMTMRSVSIPVRLVAAEHGAADIGRGAPRVTVTGDPVELTMLAFGRQRVAQVHYDGSAADIAALRDGRIAV
jgi:uncharacterized protein (TIGR03085 family)